MVFGLLDATRLWHNRRPDFDLEGLYLDTGVDMQVSFKSRTKARKKHSSARNLTELKRGESGILDRIDLPEEDARRLMEMGFLPGHAVTPAHSAPGGDPRVFRVDGSEVALRRETAMKPDAPLRTV